jgi:hypothetical protein
MSDPPEDSTAAATLLTKMGYPDLAAYFVRHGLHWVTQPDVYVFATAKEPEIAPRLLDLWVTHSIGATTEAALHARFETGLKPSNRTTARNMVIQAYLRAPPPIVFVDSVPTRAEVLGLIRNVPSVREVKTGSYLGARLMLLAHCARLFSPDDTPAHHAREFAAIMAGLPSLRPFVRLEGGAMAPASPDTPLLGAHGIGFRLGVGLPWNGPHLCPLIELVDRAVVLTMQRPAASGASFELFETAPLPVTTWVSADDESVTFVVVRTPQPSARPAPLLRALVALFGGLWLESQFGPSGFTPSPGSDADSEGFFGRAAERLRVGQWAAPPKPTVDSDRMLVRDGGRALLEGTAQVPPALPHAESLALWLSPAGDSVRGTDNALFDHAHRTRLAFFVGNELMTEATAPLWISKARRHQVPEIGRDLANILTKCASFRAPKGWAVMRRGDRATEPPQRR